MAGVVSGDVFWDPESKVPAVTPVRLRLGG